jgi:hypothetical protein
VAVGELCRRCIRRTITVEPAAAVAISDVQSSGAIIDSAGVCEDAVRTIDFKQNVETGDGDRIVCEGAAEQ